MKTNNLQTTNIIQPSDSCIPSELAYNYFGDLLVTGTFSGLLSSYLITSPNQHTLLQQLTHSSPITSLIFSPLLNAHQYLTVGLQIGHVYLYLLKDNQLTFITNIQHHTCSITAIAIRVLQPSLEIIIADHSGKLTVSNYHTNNTIQLKQDISHHQAIIGLSLGSNQSLMITLIDGTITFYQQLNNTYTKSSLQIAESLIDGQFNPGIGAANIMMGCTQDGQITEYTLDLINHKVLQQKNIYRSQSTVYKLSYNPNGTMLALSTLHQDQQTNLILVENIQGNWEVLSS